MAAPSCGRSSVIGRWGPGLHSRFLSEKQLTELTNPVVWLDSHRRGACAGGKGAWFFTDCGVWGLFVQCDENKPFSTAAAGCRSFVPPDVWLGACRSLSNRYINVP